MTAVLTDWLLRHYGREQYEPGLDRMKRALAPLMPSLKGMRTVTIAGTNGKGETTLRLSRLLGEKKHCVWTSPHVLRITERFRSEEGEIGAEELRSLIEDCHEKVQGLGLRLTYYEFLFFVFCSWAAQRSPALLLLEVGLGGRLDAVNALDAELVLLPSISRDHQEYLGNRYDLILEEKLGVLRKGAVLLSFLDLKYLRERALSLSELKEARMIDLEEHYSASRSDFSLRNQLLAHAAARFLEGKNIAPQSEITRDGPLEHRGEVVQRGSELHFFGSHNVDGLRKLIQFLKAENYNLKGPPFDSVFAGFSQRRTSDLQVMLKMLKASGLGPVTVVCFDHPKAADKELMEALTRQEGLEFAEHVDTIFQQNGPRKVLVTGSYYFLGHLKSGPLR